MVGLKVSSLRCDQPLFFSYTKECHIIVSMFQKIENLWFFTSTINSWQKILNKDNCQIIIESFNFIAINKWIKIYGFVLMPNHIHIVLSLEEKDKIAFQRDFLKHTAQQILFNLKKENNAEMLLKLTSTQNDRNFQIWERRPKWILIENELILKQKLEYIHNNPIQEHWRLCKFTDEYFFSSAKFYENGIKDFEFLNRYGEL